MTNPATPQNPARTPHCGVGEPPRTPQTNPANSPLLRRELGEFAGDSICVGGVADAVAGFSRPISALLATEDPPVCGRLTQAQDMCFRRVAAEGARCWQHR